MRANFTLFFLLVFGGAALLGREWPNIAKIMPVYVAAVPGLVLVLFQLYRDAMGSEGSGKGGGIEMDEVYEAKLEKKVELRRTWLFFGWFIGGAIGIWLLGIVIALPLLILLYTLIEGKESWITALIMTACTYLLIWGLFEYMLESRWPPGLLFS